MLRHVHVSQRKKKEKGLAPLPVVLQRWEKGNDGEAGGDPYVAVMVVARVYGERWQQSVLQLGSGALVLSDLSSFFSLLGVGDSGGG